MIKCVSFINYSNEETKTEARAIATLIKRDIKKKFPKLDLAVMYD